MLYEDIHNVYLIYSMLSDLSKISATKAGKSINDKALPKKSYKTDYKWKIVWKNVFIFSYIHLAAIYGIYMACLHAKYWSVLWCMYHIYCFFVRLCKLRRIYISNHNISIIYSCCSWYRCKYRRHRWLS